MSELHRHSCGATWSGYRTCHCSGCCATFSSTSAFDRHQNRPGVVPICKDPAEAGLVPYHKPWGVMWGWPPNESYAQFAKEEVRDGVPAQA